ncbi:uncharacterized protein LOC124436166 [Xenia sp. Carnegie-2017]|uniref:uncharacterized protein LOC124436166 n=1 Tax=Xenia sp. Carnegie-2017 TaxID=2897299 RepID=UPI001F04492E|nr:uncharacterized protein LOC124436166 [Xenia sp. Carnegie-2017]
MCKFRTLNDAPVTLRQWEQAENVYDYEYNFEKNASEEEVEAMHNHESVESPMPYRKKKAITKIFRRSSYLPSLEDIEEGVEECEKHGDALATSVGNSEDEYDLSLSAIHQERAFRYCARPTFDSSPHSRNHRHRRHRKRTPEGDTEHHRRRRRHVKSDAIGG